MPSYPPRRYTLPCICLPPTLVVGARVCLPVCLSVLYTLLGYGCTHGCVDRCALLAGSSRRVGRGSQDLQKEEKRGETSRKGALPRAIPYGLVSYARLCPFWSPKVLSRLLTGRRPFCLSCWFRPVYKGFYGLFTPCYSWLFRHILDIPVQKGLLPGAIP